MTFPRCRFAVAWLAALALLLPLTPPAHSAPAHPNPDGAALMQAQQLAVGTPPRLSGLSRAPCVGGIAAGYPCSNVDLESYMTLAEIGGGNTSGVWGWTDALNGKEYALVGRSSGTAFVDISDPARPVYLGNLPTHTVSSTWRDLKVYKNHVFVVSEAAGHGLQVFDLTRLRSVTAPPVTFSEDVFYGRFGHAHTIILDEDSGFAFAAGSDQCSGGLHMVDVRNPKVPVFAGCFSADGYTHDGQCVTYHGPDAARAGHEICFACNEDTLTVVDVTDKAAPVQLSRTDYPGRRYTHQGWLTEDHAYFLLNDEGDETGLKINTTTHIWDVRNLDAPVRFSTFVNTTKAIDHNLYIVGRRAYESNYRSGLRILDLGCIATGTLTEVGYFDVYPADDDANYNGTWANYPFYASGVVAVGGIEEGLFVVRPRVPDLPPIAEAVPLAPICAGDTVILDGSRSTACSAAGLSYRWLDGASEICPWSASPTCVVAPAATHDYKLEVECADRPGCLASAVVAVQVKPEPVADAGADLGACAGATAMLDAGGSTPCPSGLTLYRWLEGAAVICDWSTRPTCPVQPGSTTRYTLEAICATSQPCTSSDTVQVTVTPVVAAAQAGPDAALCAGATLILDGGDSATCPLGVTLYRWLEGSVERCPWSLSTSCVVAPASTTSYTLEVACDPGGVCPTRDSLIATVDPDLLPGNLGNTLRAVRSKGDVVLSWGSDALARSYALHRSIDRKTWPAAALRAGLAAPARTEPDVPGPPTLYTYRAAAASCSGREGP